MKFRVILDDADGFDDGVAQAVFRGQWAAEDDNSEETLVSARGIMLKTFIKKWIDAERYVTLEFDTTDGTAAVVPVKG